MRGAILPGQARVDLREFDVPEPGPGQALVRTKSHTLPLSEIKKAYEAFDAGKTGKVAISWENG